LTFLKRGGRATGVVDHVANASRLYIWVPKENCRLTFVLAGVRAPRVARTTGEKSEPYAEEGAKFVSNKILQRDVSVVLFEWLIARFIPLLTKVYSG
jgi:staphylococcal nuclease domain-containing protein 1